MTPSLRVAVDADLCQGHTLCNFAAPDVFHLRDEDGHAYVAIDGDLSPEQLEQFADEFGVTRAHGSYEDLVADPHVDAVYVASPHSEHHDHALLALRAGKQVLVE